MEARLIDEDLVDDISNAELINTINFPNIVTYKSDILDVMETAEKLSSALSDLMNGVTTMLSMTPSELLDFGQKCRDLCTNLGRLESSAGVTPLHLIRIVREFRTTALTLAASPELFADNITQNLKDMWGD